MQPEVHFLVQSQVHLLYTFIQILKRTYRCNSRHIIWGTLNCTIKRTSNAFIKRINCCSVCTLSSGALKVSLLLSFFFPDFGSICTLKFFSESILKCVPYILSFAISFTFGGIYQRMYHL